MWSVAEYFCNGIIVHKCQMHGIRGLNESVIEDKDEKIGVSPKAVFSNRKCEQ